MSESEGLGASTRGLALSRQTLDGIDQCLPGLYLIDFMHTGINPVTQGFGQRDGGWAVAPLSFPLGLQREQAIQVTLLHGLEQQVLIGLQLSQQG